LSGSGESATDSAGSAGSSGGTSSDAASGTPSASSPSTPSGASPDESSAADNSAKSDTSGDSGSGSVDSQGTGSSSAGDTKQDDSDNSWQIGGSSSLVDTGALDAGSGGKHRGDSAEESVLADADGAAASSGRHAARGDSYTVRSGDTLQSIADSLDLEGGWRALYAENKQAIGADPSRIVPGQTLGLGAE
jgi:nucleoid-associated protein YgaU